MEINIDKLNTIYHTLRDAGEVIQAFYPGANWAERKGMKLMMEEIERAEEFCLEVLRPPTEKEEMAGGGENTVPMIAATSWIST